MCSKSTWKSHTYVSNNTTQIDGIKFHGIFKRHANLKYEYGNRNSWAKGYYISTVGLNKKTVAKYIRKNARFACGYYYSKKIINNIYII